MKPLRPFGIFVCALFLVSGLGMMIDVILPKQARTIQEAGQGDISQTKSQTTNAALAETSAAPSVANEDIPVDSPTIYPTGFNPAAQSVCQAALKQYLSYVDARAAYLLRAGTNNDDTAQFLKTRDEAVRGELAILAAKAGTFQGNPDHFNTLTTLVAERQAVALATQWHAAEQTQHKRQEVTTYDVNLQC